MKSLQNRKLIIVSIHAEMCTLPSMQSRLLSFAIRDKLLGPRALNKLLGVLAWSMNVAFGRKWPSRDHKGDPLPAASGRQPGAHRYRTRSSPLAGPYRFAYVGSLGDQDWHDMVYKPLLNSWRHNFCCFRCSASRVFRALHFLDFSDAAGWRLTTILNHILLSGIAPEDLHPFMAVFGWHLMLIRLDWMHAHLLGVAQIANGSILWELLMVYGLKVSH